MGTEIALPVFGPLILVGLSVLLFLAWSGRKNAARESALLGLGRSRIALGYLGVLLALAACTYIDTVDLVRLKLQRGDVTQMYAQRAFVSWYLQVYCLAVPFVVATITVLGLPVLGLLRRIRLASLLGTLLVGQLAALGLALSLDIDFLSHALWAAAITVGFAIGARLPCVRSPTMPTNLRLSGP